LTPGSKQVNVSHTSWEKPLANPFEDENGEFLVLVNDQDQHSLWPAFRDVPPGWTAVGRRGKRQECLDWITANWIDMRPQSLRAAEDRTASSS
jgi:MbtH protein